MKNKLDFEERMELAIKNANLDDWETAIVYIWYDIEDEDEDISTERLIAMVCDETGAEVEDVMDVMMRFSEEMEKLKKKGLKMEKIKKL